MTSDIDALYATILKNPADLTARLVYADALDERGGVGDALHAEYIRVSIALLQNYPESEEYKAAHARQHEICDDFLLRQPSVQLPSGKTAPHMYSGGFVNSLNLWLHDQACIPEMCQRYPLQDIRFICAHDHRMLADAIAQLPETICSLGLNENSLWQVPADNSPSGMRRLIAALQQKPSIHTLNLARNHIGANEHCFLWLKELAGVRHLESLDLSYNELSYYGAGEEYIRQIVRMSNLRSLNIDHNRFGGGSEGLAEWSALAHAHLPHLETLDLRGNDNLIAFVGYLSDCYKCAAENPHNPCMLNLRRLNGNPLPPELEALRRKAYDARVAYELENPDDRVLPQEIIENAQRGKRQ